MLKTSFKRDLKLHGAVEGLTGQRGRVVVFDEARGRSGVRGKGGPCAVQTRSALQSVGDIWRAAETSEKATAAIGFDG